MADRPAVSVDPTKALTHAGVPADRIQSVPDGKHPRWAVLDKRGGPLLGIEYGGGDIWPWVVTIPDDHGPASTIEPLDTLDQVVASVTVQRGRAQPNLRGRLEVRRRAGRGNSASVARGQGR